MERRAMYKPADYDDHLIEEFDMPEQQQQIGRLAMRQEGGNWNAYYALPDSMDQPIFLGSIRMGAITGNRERKEAFMAMMRDIVSDIIEENTGVRPSWGGAVTAPEHERAGQPDSEARSLL